MTIYYLDSSAPVKRYLNETGSAWVASLFATTPDNEVFIAAITSVEVTDGNHSARTRWKH